jgi:hypothetical protein
MRSISNGSSSARMILPFALAYDKLAHEDH